MADHKQSRFRRRRAALLAVCLALLLAGVIAALGRWNLRQAEEPWVDFSDTVNLARPAPVAHTVSDDQLRFAIATMWSAESTFVMYRRLVTRIATAVGRKEAFVIRPTYPDLRDALDRQQVDVAFVGTGPYVCSLRGGQIKLLVQPEFEPGLTYRSVLLVPAGRSVRSLVGLCGATVAFSYPESFAGCFVPYMELVRMGFEPGTFFKKIVFTGNHERSIEAVRTGVVDAATVHSIVWNSWKCSHPAMASGLTEGWSSDAYGPPPVVVPTDLPPALEAGLRSAFLGLDADEDGRQILAALAIKRFVPGNPEDYGSAIQLYERFRASPGVAP